MKRIFNCITFIVVLMAIVPPEQLSGQSYLPFSQSNYSGAAGLLLQPASIADSRYRFDMTVFGAEMMANNTFVALDKKVFLSHPHGRMRISAISMFSGAMTVKINTGF